MALISGNPNLGGTGSAVSSGGFVTSDPNLEGDGSVVDPSINQSSWAPIAGGGGGAAPVTGNGSSGFQSDSAASAPTNSPVTQTPTVGNSVSGLPSQVGTSTAASSTVTVSSDMRIRLAALNPSAVYANSPIMSILNQTGGMMFPYTPNITVTQGVDYMALQLVHSDTDYQAYTRTPSVKISINGKFTVQNLREGQYAMACIHFLRTVSKSYFGEKDAQATNNASSPLTNLLNTPISGLMTPSSSAGGGNAGLPPPVLLFSGYGNLMFNRLRVILTNHSYTFDEGMDTVAIPIGGGSLSSFGSLLGGGLSGLSNLLGGGTSGGLVRIPAMFTISCDLTVIQTPQRMRQEFSFTDFANGTLMNSSDGGWI